ncbi:hypothetical protein MKW94_028617 [Papaver nudicaule]|uniref:Uncharacterized protein n=1 Tax=Papaver nudicaule TaxID=74823 RepID=A0AA42AYX9_PAPNU|nr:hypothetical protein [Papaver nudicaule]
MLDDIPIFEQSSKVEKWCSEFPDALEVLLAESRIDDLVEAAFQPSTRGTELLTYDFALKKLGGGPRAHTLLLNAHYQKFQYNMQSLRPSSTSYGGEFTICAQIALGYCSLLESRGLAPFPQAVDANLKRIEESSVALSAVNDWVLTYTHVGTRPSGGSAATSIADEPLPRAFMKLSQVGGKDEPCRGASDQQSRDTLCRQHALELIFTKDGFTHLNAETYLSMDGSVEEHECRMATIAVNMFVGREKFATVFLMRLTQTVIMWLSNHQTFWEEFYIDMEFVTLRILMSLLITQSTPKTQYSVLPEDEWYAEVAQITIKIMTDKDKYGNGDRDIESPTASFSARSIS